jgi:chemotaxis protein CheC
MEKIMLNTTQKDGLQELANIGAGHASTALSQMINREIKMGIPHVEVIPLPEAGSHLRHEQIVVGIFLKISDEIPSYVMMIIPRESAFALSDLLLGTKNSKGERILSEMDMSALSEVANVMICSFFDSVSALLGMSVVPGPPNLAYDIPDAVLDYVLIQIGEVSDEVFLFNVDLREEKEHNFEIHMFLLPEPDSITTLLERMGLSHIT